MTVSEPPTTKALPAVAPTGQPDPAAIHARLEAATDRVCRALGGPAPPARA